MPFNPKTGQWEPEDDSVATRLAALTAGDSRYIQQARTGGMQTANRRGLLNSSMAAGAAEGAAIQAALPIANADANTSATKNLSFMQGGQQMDLAKFNSGAQMDLAKFGAGSDLERQKLAGTQNMDLAKLQAGNQMDLTKYQASADMDRQRLVTASADRNASLSAALETNKAYQTQFSDLAGNKDIPAETREAYLKHLLDTRSTGFDMIQQLYGIQLNWGTSPANPVPGAPVAPVTPTAPVPGKDIMGGGGPSAGTIAQTLASPISTGLGQKFLTGGLLGGLFG